MTLVRRRDFKSKFLHLKGKVEDLDDHTLRVSFQEHFYDLTQKALKIIRRPIDTDHMQPFHLNKMSKLA